MAKLQRKSAKVFAEQAQAAVGGIAQFGSLAAGDIQYSKDVDVIQALDAYKNGWASAVIGNKSPAMEDRNALDYILSYQQAYIMQHGIPEWLSTETYYTNSYVVDSNGELRVSVGDNNIGHDPVEDEGGQYWGYAGARGSGKRVGEVYFSQSNLATDNPGALPLFTGDLVSNANNIYPEFYYWVSTHPELCVTQAQYETRISQYGECPFYVLDTGANTIRLPKLVNYIKMETSAVTQSAAGLPDHTHGPLYVEGSNSDSGDPGQYVITDYVEYNGTNTNQGHTGGVVEQTVYSKSNTVTPAHTTLFPWVCAYNAAIPASTAQAAQFLQVMSTKVDESDLSEVVCIVETWHSGTEWCRVWSDGWCEQGGLSDTIPGTGDITVNFHREYQDTDYSVFLSNASYSTGSAPGVYLKNTNLMKIDYSSASTTGKVYWETKGFIDIVS